MKKHIVFIFILVVFFCFLSGCKKDEEYTCIINCEDIYLAIGDYYTLEPTSNIKDASFSFQVVGDTVLLDEDTIEGISEGTSTIIISVNGYEGTKNILVHVQEKGIQVEGPSQVTIKEKIELQVNLFGIEEDTRIIWKSSDPTIATVSQGIVTGVKLGKVTIKIKCDEFETTHEIEVIKPLISSIVTKEKITLEEQANYTINYSVEPEYALDDIKILSDSNLIKIEDDNSITTLSTGMCTIQLVSLENENVTKTIAIDIVSNEIPVVEYLSDYEDLITITYGKSYDLITGIKVTDNVDGDITQNAEYDEASVYAYGLHTISLSFSDSAGNKVSIERKVNTVWPYKTQFIGHRGCSYGVPNTEEAFLYGASVLHYQALECDIHLTKDGVFVTNHDSYITTTNESGEEIKVTITQTDYDDLVKYELTSGSYTGHVCTLERYLEICKEYGCDAVIELKTTTGISNSSQESMPKLMELIEKHDMLDHTIILTSSENIINWLRTRYNDLPIQYLYKSELTDDVLNLCIQYNCDISVNVTYGNGISDEYIQKFHNANLKVSVWTFTKYVTYDKLQEWIDKGVDYVTCDIHSMDKVTLK